MAARVASDGLVPGHLTPSEKIEDDDDIELAEKHFLDPEQQPQHSRSSMTGSHHDDDDDEREFANTEATPFIINRHPRSSEDDVSKHHDDDDDEDPRIRLRWPVILYSFCIVFLVEVALNICWPAWNALLEQGICAEMHPDLVGLLVAGDELDARCKEADVQGRLAMYRGWSYTVDALPSKGLPPLFFFLFSFSPSLSDLILCRVLRALVTDC